MNSLFHALLRRSFAPSIAIVSNPTSLSSSSAAAIHWADEARRDAFAAWLQQMAQRHALDAASVRAASADASFRRYFRVDSKAGTRIVMDAPPAREDCRPFVNVSRLLVARGLNAPRVIEWDTAQGFMLLGDLGACTYLAALDAQGRDARAAQPLYRDALGALVQLQGIAAADQVPPYDRALLQREMDLYPQWYVAKHRGIDLDDAQRNVLASAFEAILANTLAQPAVLVHRDYHSRNLMVCAPHAGDDVGPAPNPGILDFQDAVWGPITYDLASLLRDAYIEWDEEVQIDWAARYWEQAKKAALPVAADFGDFWRDLEWMGLQRHLKVLGIFARLYHRDGKDGYLKDLPLVWRYAHRVCMRYNALAPLAKLLEDIEGEDRVAAFTF
jgi:N-acetylmuramate 1-kinase